MKFLISFFSIISFYSYSQVIPLKIANLPDEVNESSGILIDNGNIWTNNDGNFMSQSEHGKVLFLLDDNFKLKKTIKVPIGLPYDFEDLAQDSLYIYLGNMGDNNNFFPYKMIYKYKKFDLYHSENPQPEPIYFHYENQPRFLPPDKSLSNFDCESIISMDSNLYLFSKNRGISPFAYVYKLNKKEQAQGARLIDSIWTGSWVTSVAINSTKSMLALLANSKIVLISNFKNDKFSSGKYTYFTIPNSQKEAIMFKDDNTLWITDERNRADDGCVYEINIEKAVSQKSNFTNFSISPISIGKRMYIAYNGTDLVKVDLSILDLTKNVVYTETFHTTYGEGKGVKHKLKNGKYIVQFKSDKFTEEYPLEVDLDEK